MLSMEQIGYYNFMQQQEEKRQQEKVKMQLQLQHCKDNVNENNALVSECGRIYDLLRKK